MSRLATAGPGSPDRAGPPVGTWTARSSVLGWCETCGTDVEFAAPAGATPADLAAYERGCVWCGEATVVAVGTHFVITAA